jgi:hypothetical protein
LGIEYIYEPDGYNLADGTSYLPDFFLSQQNCFVEIKGQAPTKEEVNKAQLLALSQNKPVAICAVRNNFRISIKSAIILEKILRVV